MDFKGNGIIAIGERDGIQSEALSEIARHPGGEAIFTITQCFV